MLGAIIWTPSSSVNLAVVSIRCGRATRMRALAEGEKGVGRDNLTFNEGQPTWRRCLSLALRLSQFGCARR
jgi:hypothetical protein